MQSAKTNLNVEEVFFSIARDIKQRLAETDSKAEVYKYPNLVFWFVVRLQNINLFFFVMQPQTIKINKPDQTAGAAQTAQKSACCGS